MLTQLALFRVQDRRIEIKILLLDIETAPNLAHVWGIWQQNVAINQIMESGYVLCWAAKWVGQPEIFMESLRSSKRAKMLKRVHALLDEADVVVHYNGSKFDIPTLNQAFVLQGLPPPSPFKQVDLLQVVKSRFRFPSNKLEYVAKALNVGAKMKNSGHELWVKCMAGDTDGWDEMEEYNVQDTRLLEALYNKLRPWIRNHPNHGVYADGDNRVCPNCGSAHLHRRGESVTALSTYARYQCQDCGTWSRENLVTKPRKNLMRPV